MACCVICKRDFANYDSLKRRTAPCWGGGGDADTWLLGKKLSSRCTQLGAGECVCVGGMGGLLNRLLNYLIISKTGLSCFK